MRTRPWPSLLLAVAIVSLTAQTAQTQSTSLQDAQARMQSGDFAGAAEILRPLVETEPENANAWLSLSRALERSGQHGEAVTAYHKAASFPPTNARAMYNLGLLHASDGNADSAFAYLGQAESTGKVNMTRVGNDPRSQSIREDLRYASLFPTEEEFAQPFLEQVTIIREWGGEAPGDQFGWIARNIGDVDGDGINDVTTSAPSKNIEGAWAGRVYVYSSGTGEQLWQATGSPGSRLGIGIEAAGDVNADGIPDVIAGAPGEGKTYVYSGNDGRVLYAFSEVDSASGFGRKVADLGDVNADGYDDVLVGAPQANQGAGAAYVYSGNDGGVLYSFSEVDSASGFGRKVADLGDVNTDGYDDVLVGAPQANQGTGAAYVYSGKDGSVLHTFAGERSGDNSGSAAGGWHAGSQTLIAVGAPNAGPSNGGRVYVYDGLIDHPAFVMESDEGGQQLGAMFVSVVGDVDADGTPDIYASDWAHGANGPFTGRIFVNSGATGELLMVQTGEAAGDGFGIGVADAGDVDGDGHDDLIVGAWQHASEAPSGGKSYLYSGKDGHLMQRYTGIVPGETFGFDATGMGDVDGDGVDDLLITSARSAIKGTWTGRMFIIKGEK